MSDRIRTGIPVVLALVVVGWVGPLAHTVAAETLVEQDGITLSGSVRVVARGVGTCEVREASHSEEVYEQIKENHGQPLNVWRLDYSAYNGSGKPLAFLRAHFRVESQWPPCTSWSGPEGSYSKPVQWTGSFQVLKKPYGNGAGRGGERHDLRACVPRTPSEVRELGRELPVRETDGGAGRGGAAGPDAVRRTAPRADVREVQRAQPKARKGCRTSRRWW